MNMNRVKEKKNVDENLKERYPLMCYDVIFNMLSTGLNPWTFSP